MAAGGRLLLIECLVELGKLVLLVAAASALFGLGFENLLALLLWRLADWYVQREFHLFTGITLIPMASATPCSRVLI